jgi:hypothetical protein
MITYKLSLNTKNIYTIMMLNDFLNVKMQHDRSIETIVVGSDQKDWC